MHWGLWLATAGGAFQFVGVVLVFIEVAEAERLLGVRPWLSRLTASPLARLQTLLSRLGIRRRAVHLVSALDAASAFEGTVKIRVTRKLGTTVNERLAVLHLMFEDLRREIDDLEARTTAERAKLAQKLEEIEASLRASDDALRDLIKALSVGSTHIRVVGVFLILAGTAMVTVAPFLSQLQLGTW